MYLRANPLIFIGMSSPAFDGWPAPRIRVDRSRASAQESVENRARVGMPWRLSNGSPEKCQGLAGLTDQQEAIMRALVRPLKETSPFAAPATNRQIGSEVFLGVDAVKAHLRALYSRFGLRALPQNQKRARLAEMALCGALSGEPLATRSHDG